ncbi:MAG TPA: VanW family protein [Acidimicrobiia bacterium]|nr:VanW family protein [Acidimicrobiia bacterium]
MGRPYHMNKQLSFPVHPLLAAAVVVGGLFVVLLTFYGITRWMSADEVMGRVDVAEAELGGKTVDEAYNEVTTLEIKRLGRIAHFEVDGNEVELEPGYTGLDIDEDDVVGQAMAVGREGNFANQFLFWLTNIFSTTEIPLEATVNESAMNDLFNAWDSQVINKPIVPGSVELQEGVLVPVYPATGVGVDREPALEVVVDSLLAETAETNEVPTVVVEPVLTAADVDAALAEAQLMLAAPITLTYQEQSTIVGVEQLQAAFVSETMTNSPPEIINSFDPAVVNTFIDPIRADFEAAPVNAELVINDDNTVSVVPGSNGTRIDEVETAVRLYDASQTAARTAELPIVEGAEPERTTEYLEGLGVKHLVSQFTTYHDCCAPRVINIHLIADTIDGHIVLPGETFSINDFVGERTIEKGYVDAGSIVAGEIVDTVGGGTSQFATTFYNAVYWGGYQDVEHQPHSYYFSRYPEGVEATLFWRSIDLKFRNNRDHAILIDTRHTDTSITVRFFGFNDGRTLVGEQSGGETHIRVAAEGGPEALHVRGETSERTAFTDPGEPVYRPNPELGVDEQDQTQTEAQGWSVTVTRTILRGGTEQVEQQTWNVRYSPQFAVYEVHPCKVPGTSVACPTTTTTTQPTTTTTTTPTAPP